MKNTIKLDNPVQINGKSYNELTYDISEITAQAFAEADARKLSASRMATQPARPSWTTACTSTSASLPSSRSTLRSTSPTSSASAATTL